MGDLIGVNIKREDPTQFLNCFGFAREYHDWVVDDGNYFSRDTDPKGGENCINNEDDNGNGDVDCADLECICESRLYPVNSSHWNPGYQGQSYERFNDFYARVLANLTPATATPPPICATMKHNLPQILLNNGLWPGLTTDQFNTLPAPQEYKPIFSSPIDFDATHPQAYEYYTDWVTQFAAQFVAAPANPASPFLAFNYKSSDVPHTGLVGYIEPWNEPDKTDAWFGTYNGPHPEMVGFTAQEYAAFATAVVNGGNMVGEPLDANGQGYRLGLDQFLGLTTVMAGVSEFDDVYVQTAIAPFASSSPANFHHYCDSKWDGVDPNGIGVSPEEDTDGTLTFKHRMRDLRAQFSRPLWLSEFGWDTNNGSPQRVPTIPANPAGTDVADQQEVQGCWIVRGFLETAAAGWDRAMVFFLADDESTPGAGLFKSSGVVKDKTSGFQPKKSYWYVSTMKNVLNNTQFKEELSGDDYSTDFLDPRVLRFEGIVAGYANDQKTSVYAVWSPTTENATYAMSGNDFFTIENIPSGISDAVMVEMMPNDANGIRTKLKVNNNKVLIPAANVNERPIFVIIGNGYVDPVALPICANANSHGISCEGVKVEWDIPVGLNFDHFMVYYYDRPDGQTPSPLTFNIGDPFWKLYAADLTGTCNQAVIGGIKTPNDNLQIVVLGVTTDGLVTPTCISTVRTLDCAGKYMIKPASFTANFTSCAQTVLFNYDGLDFCSPDFQQVTGQWPTPGTDDCGSNQDVLNFDITFNQDYNLQNIKVLDGDKEGLLEILYNTDGSNDFLPATSYFTQYQDIWNNIPFPICTPIRRLRFKASYQSFPAGGGGNYDVVLSGIKRIVLYGLPVGLPEPPADCCGSANAYIVENKKASELPDLTTSPEIVVTGTLTINQNTTFDQIPGKDRTQIFMKPGSRVLVEGNKILTVQGNTLIKGCDEMWKGIELNPNAIVTFRNSRIQDAYKAFQIKRTPAFGTISTKLTIDESKLFMNYYGVYIEKGANTFSVQTPVFVYDTKFDGLGLDLKHPYNSQLIAEIGEFPISNTGVVTNNVRNININGSAALNTVFNRMDNGIVGANSNIYVSNSRFENLVSRQNSIGAIVGGDGISLASGLLVQTGLGISDNPDAPAANTFNRVTTAFRITNASASITKNTAVNVDEGIIGNGIKTFGSHIKNNRFTVNNNGFRLTANVKPVVVRDNHITHIGTGPAFGIEAALLHES